MVCAGRSWWGILGLPSWDAPGAAGSCLGVVASLIAVCLVGCSSYMKGKAGPVSDDLRWISRALVAPDSSFSAIQNDS
jgi:hypothetical protein